MGGGRVGDCSMRRSDRALRGDRRQTPALALLRRDAHGRSHLVDQRHAGSAGISRMGAAVRSARVVEQSSRATRRRCEEHRCRFETNLRRWSAAASVLAALPGDLAGEAAVARGDGAPLLPRPAGRVDPRARGRHRPLDGTPGRRAPRREPDHGRRFQPRISRTRPARAPSEHASRSRHVALDELPAESFDYIVGTAILCHTAYAENLAALYRLLKPGGQLLFFEANYWNPQVFLKSTIRPLGRWTGDAECQIGMRKFQLMKQASHQGFTHVEVVPYDILHPLTPRVMDSQRCSRRRSCSSTRRCVRSCAARCTSGWSSPACGPAAVTWRFIRSCSNPRRSSSRATTKR